MRAAESRSGYTRTGGISGKNRAYLETLHRDLREPFGSEEAAEVLDLSRERASRLLRHLTAQGWLARVKQGLYVPVPLEARTSGDWIEDPWLVASKAFEPCFIGGWSACEHWGLTEQIFNEIAVVSAKPVRDRRPTIQGTRFRIKVVEGDQIFGPRAVWRHDSKVEVSDPSRTVVDMLDDPSFGGGIRHVAHALSEYFDSHLDEQVLLSYAELRRNRSVYKRLGYLIEAQTITSPRLIDSCRSRMSTGVVDLDPAVPERGRITKRWNLRINIDVTKGNVTPDSPRDTGEGGKMRMDLESLLRSKREAILELAAKNGAKRVRVFGSVSRGEAGEDSDVDFLVELDEDRSLVDHSRLILDLEKLLGRRVHVVTPGSLHRVIRDQVMAEARPL
jgi:predicted transcriptional regulator of viral defense system/predicted nucleotidyltransferase